MPRAQIVVRGRRQRRRAKRSWGVGEIALAAGALAVAWQFIDPMSPDDRRHLVRSLTALARLDEPEGEAPPHYRLNLPRPIEEVFDLDETGAPADRPRAGPHPV